MPTVKCHNDVSISGELKGCNKFLVILPHCVVGALKDNPDQKIIVRCHDCPKETKWVDVFYNLETGFTWSIHDGDVEFGDDMKFDTILKSGIVNQGDI